MAERATTASIAASVAAHLAAFVAMGFVDPVEKLDAIEVMYMPGAVEPMRVQAEPIPTPTRSDVPSSAGSRPSLKGTRPARQVEEADSKPVEDEAPNDAAAVPLTDFREGSRAVEPAAPIDPKLFLGGRDVMPEIDKAKPEGPARPKDPLGSHGFAPNGDGTFSYVDPQKRCGGRPCFRATLRRDGRVEFKGTIQPMASPAMKSLLNRQKAELLKATYEIRLAMAVRFAREQLDRRLNSLRREIGALWDATNQSEARRRELIFERWDECEEPGPAVLPGFEGEASELDKARVDSGTEARETIESWVRKKLPKGSDIAYTSEELRLLNSRRHSKKAFAPYD